MRFGNACVRVLFLVGLFSVAAASPAAAQGPAPANLSVGYALLTDSLADETLAAGWTASGALRLHRLTSIAVDVGGNYKSSDDAEVRVHGFMGGLRFASDRDTRVVPFAQILVGLACYCGTTTTFGDTSNRFAFQPGAGVDVTFAPAFALRVQADLRRVSGADGADGSTQFRIGAGLVLRFGQ